MNYRILDVKDENGMVALYRVLYHDLAIARQSAINEPAFQHTIAKIPAQSRLDIYLIKKITEFGTVDQATMRNALNLILVCKWYAATVIGGKTELTLFLRNRSWINAIKRSGRTSGIDVISAGPSLEIGSSIRRRMPSNLTNTLRKLRYGSTWRSLSEVLSRKTGAVSAPSTENLAESPCIDSEPERTYKHLSVATDYIGHLNLQRAELHSNLFFWQQSSLPAESVTLLYPIPDAPLDKQQLAELNEVGIQAVVLHPGATTIPSMPVLNGLSHSPIAGPEPLSLLDNGPDSRWLKQQVAEFHKTRTYWQDVFTKTNVKVYTTYDAMSAAHCAVADALHALGGVTAIYRRSFEDEASPINTIGADIMFDFSKAGVSLQRKCNSVINYHVITGYLGDHRFALLRERAGAVKSSLKKRGAKHIMTFFDENSFEDSREGPDHRFAQENYRFLFEKLQSDPTFGLVLKPKTPQTLRRRLGPVADLLDRCISSGRCYIYEETGSFQGSYPPAVGALEADVAVGLLSGGTAATEAILAGVPTLLLDREGLPTSPFYELGVGRVVFNDWETLWAAWQQHCSTPGGTFRNCDWTPIIDDLDPFRDGRAAERMGTYIHWLLNGFQAGLDRKTVMANAAERYSAAWGNDKVTQIN